MANQRVRLKEDILGPTPNYLTIQLAPEEQAKINAVSDPSDKTIVECRVRWWKWEMEKLAGVSHEPAIIFTKGDVVNVIHEYGNLQKVKAPWGDTYQFNILVVENDQGLRGCIARDKTEPV